MHSSMRVLLVALILAMAAPALAAAPAPSPGKPAPDTPAKPVIRQTQISVQHEGIDSIGARLSTQLKEMFNSSNLFQLNEKDAPKVRLLLNTQPEFPTRPGVGSVYSIIWIYSQSENHLGYLLAREVGTLSADEVEKLAAKIVERTDGIAVKYGYLFQ